MSMVINMMAMVVYMDPIPFQEQKTTEKFHGENKGNVSGENVCRLSRR